MEGVPPQDVVAAYPQALQEPGARTDAGLEVRSLEMDHPLGWPKLDGRLGREFLQPGVEAVHPRCQARGEDQPFAPVERGIGPLPLDLVRERKAGDLIRSLIGTGAVAACHDISDGGLLVTVAEMAMASGKLGADVAVPNGKTVHGWCFGEDQGRYVVETSDPDSVIARSEAAGVPAARIGQVQAGDQLTGNGVALISLSELKTKHEAWLPDYMAAGA